MGGRTATEGANASVGSESRLQGWSAIYNFKSAETVNPLGQILAKHVFWKIGIYTSQFVF